MNNVSKFLLGSAIALFSAGLAHAAMPTIVVLPDKAWATAKGYIIESVRNGKTVTRIDYNKALVDPEFKNVQDAIQAAMAERDFRLPDLQTSQDQDEEEEMYEEAFESAQTGSDVQSNALDDIMKNTKPDILLNIYWDYNTSGSTYTCNFSLKAVDAYSTKAIGAVAGNTGERRRIVPISVALKEAFKSNMDDFCVKLGEHFNDVEENGREMRLNVRIANNGAGLTMSTEFDGTELGEIIQKWLDDNTVNHQYSMRNSGRNMISFDQVRIPMLDAKGRHMDAKGFAGQLQKYLKQYGLTCDIANSSLGYARIFIGEK